MKINSLSNFKYNLSNVGIKSNRQNSYKTAPMPSDSVSFGYFPSRYSHEYETELYKKTGFDAKKEAAWTCLRRGSASSTAAAACAR